MANTMNQLIEHIAAMCHAANAAYCRSIGDFSQADWGSCEEWQRESARKGVMFHAENPLASAGATHDNWFKDKQADGWSYGPEKDVVNKRHPCMVPFAELPIEQQIKDHIFLAIARSQLTLFGGVYDG